MKMAKYLLALISLTMLTVTLGCNTGAPNQPVSEETNSVSPSQLDSILGASEARTFGTQSIANSASMAHSGIWASGSGIISIKPDIAILKLGVEVKAKTVGAARNEAAEAMTKIMQSLRSQSVQEKDIQTSYYNISPEYIYVEVKEDRGNYHKQVLDSYRVSNTVTVTMRNLDSLGDALDQVIESAGDLTRIQNIQFTLEDSSEASSSARAMAVADAITKAQQFAQLTGVSKGQLLYIAETSGALPVVREFGRMEAMAVGDSFSTPISTGEIDIQVNVETIFAIN